MTYAAALAAAAELPYAARKAAIKAARAAEAARLGCRPWELPLTPEQRAARNPGTIWI